MQDLTVIIVTWNCASEIEACLRSLERHAPDAQVVVVDNASGDGTVRAVRRGFPRVRVIESGGNVGFPAACNLGARAAEGRLLLFLNPDTRLENDVPSALARVFDDRPDAGAAGPRIQRPDGRLDASMARRFPSPRAALFRQLGLRWMSAGRLGGEALPAPGSGPPVAAPCLTGAAVMVPAALYRELGGMDETLPMYFEDLDLCRRIAQAGRKLYIAPAALLTHAGAASAGRSQRRSILLAAEDGHAPWLYLARHGAPGRAALFRMAILVGALARLLAGGVCLGLGRLGLRRLRPLAERVMPRAWALARWALTPPGIFQAALWALFDRLAEDPGEAPETLSLIIHNRDRADALDRCLASVAEQTCRPLEVLVLDAQSGDGSVEVARRWCETLRGLGIEASLSQVAPAGVSASRNLGAGLATGGLLCFIDNDAVLERPETLERARARMAADPGLGALAMRILGPEGSEMDALCWAHRRDAAAWGAVPFPSFAFAGTGFCLRAEAFGAVEGFWEPLIYSREEEELCLGLLDLGWSILYAPEAAVRHFADRRGRMDMAGRRRAELRNGLMVLWRRLPQPLAAAACCARVASMALRGVLADSVAPRALLGAVSEARALWREEDCRRKPVSWRTATRFAALHITLGGRGGSG